MIKMRIRALYYKSRYHALAVLSLWPFLTGVAAVSDTIKDTIPPVVTTDLQSTLVSDENLFFSGEAFDDGGVAQLFVNQCPLEIRAGKHVFFNHFLSLHEGENIVTVKAVDAGGGMNRGFRR